MNSYLDIANSPAMWVACSAIFLVVFFQAIRLTVISFRAGKSLGLSKAKMLSALRIGFTATLVPAIAILLGLALLIPKLGLPFPWMRLSVLGSVTFELIAAGTAATELGLDGLNGEFSPVVFTNVVWTMSLGAILHLFVVAFFTPKIDMLKKKVAGGDEGWMKVMTAAAFFGAVSYMVAQPVSKGGAPLVALAGGFLAMVAIGAFIRVAKQNWMKEWALALSIVGGMSLAGLAFLFFGIGG